MDPVTRASAVDLIRIALAEDLGERGDLTSDSTIEESRQATVNIVSRQPGVLCGGPLIATVFDELQRRRSQNQQSGEKSSSVTSQARNSATEKQETPEFKTRLRSHDGDTLEPGQVIASVSGPVRLLLAGERTILNFLIHLSGIASRTALFVEKTHGTRAVILDTRKTLPGYRLLHKYAVRCGGGTNHRMGLFDGILIKDNHLAARTDRDVSTAVADARRHLQGLKVHIPIEIEVDTLEQLQDALRESPEIVLLDNMTPDLLSKAIAIRDEQAPETKLEASGGINLDNVRQIAQTGVDRISIGGLTHSSPALDLGFDWAW